MNQINKVVRWSQSEDNNLLKEYQEGTSIADIAKEHQRSEGAILIRLKKIAVKMRINEVDDDTIFKATGVVKEDIDEQIKIENRQKNKNLTGNSLLIRNLLKEIDALL